MLSRTVAALHSLGHLPKAALHEGATLKELLISGSPPQGRHQ